MRSLLALSLLLAPVVAHAADDPPSCDPKSPTEWATKCLTDAGRDDLAGLLGAVRRVPLFADVDTAAEACDILRPGSADTECRRARRQLFALLLNRAAGRLGPACCVETGGARERLADLVARDERDCREGRRCTEIKELLAAVNSGDHVVPCSHDHEPSPSSGCCRPRGKGFWHRQCLGIGALSPGRGQGQGPGLHPAFGEEELRRILRRADARTGGHGPACAALDEANHGSSRGRARAQFAALVLNAEAGYLDGCDGDGAIRRLERMLDAERWDDAAHAAQDCNEGVAFRRCDGDREEDDEREREHDDDDRDRGGKDKGKSKGKGHD